MLTTLRLMGWSSVPAALTMCHPSLVQEARVNWNSRKILGVESTILSKCTRAYMYEKSAGNWVWQWGIFRTIYTVWKSKVESKLSGVGSISSYLQQRFLENAKASY